MARKYEILMSDGDAAEADNLAAAMTAAKTMREDAQAGFPVSVRVNGKHSMWATTACREHVRESS